jgi:hypothetical protein
MKLMYQMDAMEMSERLKEDPNYVETVEDRIENLRQSKLKELKESGKKGTPVTAETLKVWMENKRKRKFEENSKLVQIEMRKKKGGKGLSVLSGRALYEYNKELFIDDKDANDVDTKAIGGLNEGEEEEEGNSSSIFHFADDADVAGQRLEEHLFLGDDTEDLDDLVDVEEEGEVKVENGGGKRGKVDSGIE